MPKQKYTLSVFSSSPLPVFGRCTYLSSCVRHISRPGVKFTSLRGLSEGGGVEGEGGEISVDFAQQAARSPLVLAAGETPECQVDDV